MAETDSGAVTRPAAAVGGRPSTLDSLRVGILGDMMAEFLGTFALICFGDGVVAMAVAALNSSGRAATNTRWEKTWRGRPPAFSISAAAARKSSVYKSNCRFMASNIGHL